MSASPRPPSRGTPWARAALPPRPATRRNAVGDLRCPRCDYNLRGLSGPRVACPECGTSYDLERLERYTREIHTPPVREIGLLAVPMIFVVLAWLGGEPVWQFVQGRYVPFPTLVFHATLGLTGIVGWLMCQIWLMRHFGGLWALGASLVLHVAVAFYGGAVVLMVGVWAVLPWGVEDALVEMSTSLLIAVLVLYLLRRGERWVALRCRRHRIIRAAGRLGR